MAANCGGRRRGSRFVLLLAILAALQPAVAAGQSATYFSPTYAASAGSPYSEIYARTFGAGGPPIETSAPPPVVLTPPARSALPADNGSGNGVVYVIEDGRLLTFRAEDYASGSGVALVRTPLPPAESAQSLGALQLRVPTIADRLYGVAPLETAAGPDQAPAPLQLVPPQN